jgi:hypothetical protein
MILLIASLKTTELVAQVVNTRDYQSLEKYLKLKINNTLNPTSKDELYEFLKSSFCSKIDHQIESKSKFELLMEDEKYNLFYITNKSRIFCRNLNKETVKSDSMLNKKSLHKIINHSQCSTDFVSKQFSVILLENSKVFYINKFKSKKYFDSPLKRSRGPAIEEICLEKKSLK